MCVSVCKLTETSPEQLQEVTLKLAKGGRNTEEETDERLWNKHTCACRHAERRRSGHLLGEVVHEPVGVLRGEQQLPLVGLRHAVTLEAVLSTRETNTLKVTGKQNTKRTNMITTRM